MIMLKKTHHAVMEAQKQESKDLTQEIGRLNREIEKLQEQADTLRQRIGLGHVFTVDDLEVGTKVYHFSGLEPRMIVENPKGKFELLFTDGHSWKSTAMGQVDSLQKVYEYMKKSKYLVKPKGESK